MRVGPIVAKRYRKQYCKRNKWLTYQDWEIQPESMYIILRELKTKQAVDALMGSNSWTKRLPKASLPGGASASGEGSAKDENE